MVSAAVPDEVSVTVFVIVEFRASVPKATLLLLSVSPGAIPFSVRAKVFDTTPADAVSVAVCVLLTAVAVAVKLALVAPDPIVTDPGTVTALVLLDKVTTVAAVAADVSDTVQASLPAPVSDPLLQETALILGELDELDELFPVPLRLTANLELLLSVLLIVTLPVAAPATVGSNFTVSEAEAPGFRVRGNCPPASANSAPLKRTELIVTGEFPVDDKTSDCVATVPTGTFPKAREDPLALSVAEDGPNWMVKVFETPPAVAVSVADADACTPHTTAALNCALLAPDETQRPPGIVTAPLLLDKVTGVPPAAAGAASVIAQGTSTVPLTALVVHVRELSCGVLAANTDVCSQHARTARNRPRPA